MMEHIKGLAHVAIYTKDIEESIAFYQKIGGAVLDRSDPPGKRLALVKLAGTILELLEFPDGITETEGCISHIALAVDDVDAAAAELSALGVAQFETPEKQYRDNFGGLEMRYFRGPGGERIELLKMFREYK